MLELLDLGVSLGGAKICVPKSVVTVVVVKLVLTFPHPEEKLKIPRPQSYRNLTRTETGTLETL